MKNKKWYFRQKSSHAAYDIYNSNKMNSHVCQVCGRQEAEDIVNIMNMKDNIDKEKLRNILIDELLKNQQSDIFIDKFHEIREAIIRIVDRIEMEMTNE